MSTLKALTLTQPWATLVAAGEKRIETRSWSTPYRGLIAIHAAKSFPSWAKDTCSEHPFYELLVKHRCLWPFGDETLTYKAAEHYAALPLGSIVAIARLVDVVSTGNTRHDSRRGCPAFCISQGTWGLNPQEYAFGDFTPGRFAWLLADVRPLPEPLPCKGALGLWTVPNDIVLQINRIIGLAPIDARRPDATGNEAKRIVHDEHTRTPAH